MSDEQSIRDDEWDALAQLIFERSHTPDDPLNLWDGDINKLVGTILAAGFRRTVQGEPNVSNRHETDISAGQMSVQGEPTDPNQIPDEAADAAQIAMHEYCFGPNEPVGRLSVARQGWKVALAAAAAVREENQ